MADTLAKKEIDGVLLPWEAVSSFKIDAQLRRHTELDPDHSRLYSSVYLFAMNAAAYKSLPDDLKKIILDNSGAQICAWLARAFDDAATATRKRALDRGDAIRSHRIRTTDPLEDCYPSRGGCVGQELNSRGAQGNELIDSAREAIVEFDAPR